MWTAKGVRQVAKLLPERLTHQGWVLVLVPLIFEVVLISVLSFFLLQLECEAASIERSRNIVMETETLQRLCLEMGTTLAAYAVSKNPENATQFLDVKSRVLIQLGLLRDTVDDDPAAVSAVARISESVQNEVAHSQSLLNEIENDNNIKPRHLEEINANILQLSDGFSNIIKQQRELLKSYPEVEGRLRHAVEQWAFIGVGMNILIAIALAAYFNSTTTRRMNQLVDNTERLGRSERLLSPLEGNDEIARLDNVFRRMAHLLIESARKERTIFENSIDVICTLDEDLKFTAVNQASRKQWAYDQDYLVGRRLVDIMSNSDSKMSDAFRQAIQSSHIDHAVEIAIKSKSGDLVDTLWSIRWSDTESQFFCVSHDLTERKRLDQIRRDLVAMVSHDLRSPLTSIIVGLQHLGSTAGAELKDPVKPYLDRIETSASQMVRLVNDFLDLEKIQSDLLSLDIDRTNLDVIVATSIQSISSLAEAKNVSIEAEFVDFDLMVDGARIVQVLVNLLSNAIKYSPRGGEIVVLAKPIEDGIEISVTDRGPGIPEEVQEAIFDRFFQVDDNPSTSAYPSTGLGLSICSNLVRLHGGDIGVRSTLGEGSTFWFRLPRHACCYLIDSEAR